MAVINKISMSTLGGGGSSSGTKKKSTISTSYSDNLLGGGVSNPQISLPQNLLYRDNLVNLQPVGGKGAGAGGVTNEGVVLGNPNVERMPTINRNSSSAHQFKTFGQLVDETGKDLTSYAANGIGGDTSVQESVLRRGTPEWDAVMSPLNIEGQNSGAATGDGAMTTYAANGIGAEDTGATGGATGSKGSTGGSTAGSGEVDTYEEFLLKQEGFYKEQLDKLNAQIEQNKQNALQQAELQRQETEAQAESERERGVIDARSSYAQNLATYGANAEALASMGLSGSGYSDYLTQQAYAIQRAETQNANAQAEATKLNAKYTADAATLAAEQQANSDKLNAELSYAENLQNNAEKLAQYQQQKADEAKAEEEQKYQNYLTVLDAAKSGNYTSEEIAQIAQNYGFDEAMVESLTNAASTAQSDQKTDSTTEYYAALLASANSGKYTSEQIASLGAQYGLDEVQISQLQAAAESYEQQKYADNYATILDQMLSELPYYNDDNKLVIKEQDRNKMLEFLEENKGSLGEQLYDFYKKQIDNIEVYSEQAQKDDETAKQEEQQKEEDKQIITGNDSIEYNGKYYRLDSQLDKGANQIVRNNDFKDKLKELGYSDPFDKR